MRDAKLCDWQSERVRKELPPLAKPPARIRKSLRKISLRVGFDVLVDRQREAAVDVRAVEERLEVLELQGLCFF